MASLYPPGKRDFSPLHEIARLIGGPRKLGQKHIQAMVRVWQAAHLVPATIQTYFSFLRGFSGWIGKPGMVRDPAHYGMQLDEYRRSEAAQRDRSWSAQSVDIDAVITRICDHNRYVGASLRLIRAFGLRRKEALMLRPHREVVEFEATGLPLEQPEAQLCLRIGAGAKGGRERFIPLDTPERMAALAHAQQIAGDQDAHMGNPARDLKYNLHRFSHVLEQFGITSRALGVTAHGLRHEALIDHYRQIAGKDPPVRGGGASGEFDRPAREAVARLAGHSRTRVADAYLGRSARPATLAQEPRSSPPAIS
ncbi:MAG TPA: integrase domain-containing protein [Rhodopila sp.]